MTSDIAPILENWPYEPGKFSVRKIVGRDGRPKIQLRLDLGLLQMEVDGRPDGQRPHGFESLLAFHEDRLRRYREKHGDDTGFSLGDEACEQLRGESMMYYHRYLSEFALEEYVGVERDTARNLQVLDLCNRYAANENDRLMLEQYRPYIVMMHARAGALEALRHDDFDRARESVEQGLAAIKEFLEKYGQEQLMESSGEVAVLQTLMEDIENRQPADSLGALEKSLARAVQEERYEEAARIRDRIRTIREARTQ